MLLSSRRRAAAALAAFLLVATTASGQARQFTGQVVSVSGSALDVVDRRGDRLSFQRDAQTRVEGKGAWEALAPGDRVIVEWSLGDGPRRAQRVIVLGAGG